ncbi:hypothetical protein M408DRAFT_22460 [Serendipita vermifera MAFF 305830]|uniref:DRBM domain-containing protein n=1 Tax=Serendipita vermifera MAFF 305830 TaxID=933852 RepID=A0A0C3AZV2_SERVB|nr:hypothetical protein M408DRAFT_22460 [Serendipita vermifera MAFF 305830]
MSANQPTAPHIAPPNHPPDYWRQLLNALATSCNLRFRSDLEYVEEQRAWWATYHLLNPDNTNANYLGMDNGTSQDIAKEWAARQSYETLVTLIQQWTQAASQT